MKLLKDKKQNKQQKEKEEEEREKDEIDYENVEEDEEELKQSADLEDILTKKFSSYTLNIHQVKPSEYSTTVNSRGI